MCPVCNKPYEYCHGEFKIPYFRHKDKSECDDIYSEFETEEHIEGKTDLYEWTKDQNGVTDAILEGWISETHQRPDIMFKYDNKQFVIEYQCTPIASEYVKRHQLYQAAGIIDIWIIGTYNFYTDRGKMIEKFALAYYDVDNSIFSFINHLDDKYIELNNLSIVNIIQEYEKCKNKLQDYLKEKEKIRTCNQFITTHYDKAIEYLNDMNLNCIFVYCDKKSQYYTSKIYCNFRNNKINDLTIFIKPDKFDVCYYDYSYKTIFSTKYNTFDLIAFIKIVSMVILRYRNNNL